MSILFLVGARASGKTTIGKALAKKLDLPFADTDQHLLDSAGRTVDQIVAEEGWPGFRTRESAALRDVADAHRGGCVVATGGGMVLAEANRQLMRQRGMVVFLDAPVQVLAERLGRNPLNSQRPSLTGQGLVEESARCSPSAAHCTKRRPTMWWTHHGRFRPSAAALPSCGARTRTRHDRHCCPCHASGRSQP